MTRPDFTLTAEDARVLAASARVCGRPMLRRVHDRATGVEGVVPIPCGSTREAVCPACARKARIIRIQQCQEGWHLTDEPERRPPRARRGPAPAATLRQFSQSVRKDRVDLQCFNRIFRRRKLLDNPDRIDYHLRIYV